MKLRADLDTNMNMEEARHQYYKQLPGINPQLQSCMQKNLIYGKYPDFMDDRFDLQAQIENRKTKPLQKVCCERLHCVTSYKSLP